MFLEKEDIVWFQIRCGLSVETLILCCAGEEVRLEVRIRKPKRLGLSNLKTTRLILIEFVF